MVASLALSYSQPGLLCDAKPRGAAADRYRLPRLGFGASLKRTAGSRELLINKMDDYARTMDMRKYRDALLQDMDKCWSAASGCSAPEAEDWMVVGDTHLPKVGDGAPSTRVNTPGQDVRPSSTLSGQTEDTSQTWGDREKLFAGVASAASSRPNTGTMGSTDALVAEHAKCDASVLRALSSRRSTVAAATRGEHLKRLLVDMGERVPSMGLLARVLSAEIDALTEDVGKAALERVPFSTALNSRTYPPQVVQTAFESLAGDMRQLQQQNVDLQTKLDAQTAANTQLEQERTDLLRRVAHFEQQFVDLDDLAKASHGAIFNGAKCLSPPQREIAPPASDSPTKGTLLARRQSGRRAGGTTYDVDDPPPAGGEPVTTKDLMEHITSECHQLKAQCEEYRRAHADVLHEYKLCVEENEELQAKLVECVDKMQDGKQQRKDIERELRACQYELEKFEGERKLDKYGKASNKILALLDDIAYLTASREQLVCTIEGLVPKHGDAPPTPEVSSPTASPRNGGAGGAVSAGGRVCGRETRQALSFRLSRKKDRFNPIPPDTPTTVAAFPAYLKTRGDKAPKVKMLGGQDVKHYIKEFYEGGRLPADDYQRPFNPNTMKLVAMDRAFERWVTGKWPGAQAADYCYSITFVAAREAAADAEFLIFLRTVERTLPYNFPDYVRGCVESLKEALKEHTRGGILSLKDFLRSVEEGFSYKSQARLAALTALCLQYPDGLKENVAFDTILSDASPLANELKRQFMYEQDDVMTHIRRTLINATTKYTEDEHVSSAAVLGCLGTVLGAEELGKVESVVESQLEAARRYRLKLAGQGMAVSARLANARSNSRAGVPASPAGGRRKSAVEPPPDGFCASAAENTFPLSTFLRAIACTVILRPPSKAFAPDFEQLGAFDP
eukprot:TRINITY_DN18183_c0_g1_i1.p1 TRINITY_DN18183_c0_g1~~TRINITY_DN18183_c0_g1_i1.p1  ORF type:complete len:904 (+),score=278.66 TRINITY_DN18183_c0_g1_i1:61-2772(+)